MSRQRKISAFFGQGQPENNAENTETDEAEPGKDQGSELKAKVAKRNFQDSCLEKYKWLKCDPAKGTPMDFPKITVLCSVRVANNQVNPILSPVVA